jgi:hypothetical protein
MTYSTNPTIDVAIGGQGIPTPIPARPGTLSATKSIAPATEPLAREIHPAGLNAARGRAHLKPDKI